MVACPWCYAENKSGFRFCTRCGARLAKASRKQDRRKRKRRRLAASRAFPALFGAVVLIVVFTLLRRTPASKFSILEQPRIAEQVDYGDDAIRMSPLESKVADDRIAIPVRAVIEKKLVRFVYVGERERIPLLAYLTPSGRLVTAVSICEPCGSTWFHIERTALVCNPCGTRWNLETLTGISGGCLAYPPALLPSGVREDTVVIDERAVRSWKLRP